MRRALATAICRWARYRSNCEASAFHTLADLNNFLVLSMPRNYDRATLSRPHDSLINAGLVEHVQFDWRNPPPPMSRPDQSTPGHSPALEQSRSGTTALCRRHVQPQFAHEYFEVHNFGTQGSCAEAIAPSAVRRLDVSVVTRGRLPRTFFGAHWKTKKKPSASYFRSRFCCPVRSQQ